MTDKMLFDLFIDTCSKFPNSNCLTYISEVGTSTITYKQMEYMVSEICSCCNSLNITMNDFVGIIATSLSSETIAAMISVVKFGAAFIFLESTNNVLDIAERLNIRYFICEQSHINNIHDKLKTIGQSEILVHGFCNNFKILEREIQHTNRTNRITNNLAFGVFSSGSTGVQKIIQVPHRCILPNILDLKALYQLQPSDTIYVSTPPTFDPCILDIFLAFSAGSGLLVLANKFKFDQKLLVKAFTEIVTVLYITPSLFHKTFPKKLNNSSLRILTFGGESFPKLNVEQYPFLEKINVYNIYGISEVSCWASVGLVTQFDNVSLGDPLTDTVFQLRNSDGIVVQEGVGELFIGSNERICLIDGENNEKDETSLHIRPTGDLVKIVDNKYYYVGRKDCRIKLFGHQIYLSTIDAVALLHSAVKCCHSVFIQEESKIVLFVEPCNSNLKTETLEGFLKSQLPSHMIPADIFLMEEIPLNEHGKICGKSCQSIYESMKNKNSCNVTSEFRKLWMKLTVQESTSERIINGKLGFLDSGGNSILALQFTNALAYICQVPNEFIVALLSNSNYNQCLKLITSSNVAIDGTSSAVCNKPAPQRSENETNEVDSENSDCTPSSKRIKLDHGKLKQIRCRGKTRTLCSGDDVHQLEGTKMKLRWKHDMLKCVDSSPTLLVFERSAIVICGSHSGRLLVVDVESGDKVSEFTLPDRIESAACASLCGKYFYIGCYDGKMYCCDTYSGCVDWSYQTGDVIKSTPEYFAGKIYFGSYDHYFYCLSQDGILLWRTNIDESSIYATALVKEDILVVATLGGTVAFLEHDGCVRSSVCYEKPFFSSPCEVHKSFCLIIDVSGIMRLLNVESKKQVWQHQVEGNVFSSVSVNSVSDANKIVFGCYDRQVHCFEITESALIPCWQMKLDTNIYATPFFHRYADSGCEEADSSKEFVIVASISGTIYYLDSTNGNIVLSHPIKEPVFSSLVVYKSRVVVGCRDNNLYCLEVTPPT